MSDAKTKTPEADLLGRPLTETEREIVAAHQHLESIVQRPDLSPCTDRGLRSALAVTWQVLNDLDIPAAAPEDV